MDAASTSIHMWLTFAIIAGAITLYASEKLTVELISLGTIALLLLIFEVLPQQSGTDLPVANLLDGFAISRTFSTEYVRGTLQLFPMHWTMDMGREKFRTQVSDHLPFVASFRIDKDRD